MFSIILLVTWIVWQPPARNYLSPPWENYNNRKTGGSEEILTLSASFNTNLPGSGGQTEPALSTEKADIEQIYLPNKDQS